MTGRYNTSCTVRFFTAHMSNKKFKLCILPGYRCNFACAHCSATLKTPKRLTDSEVKSILEAIKAYKIISLHFVGGEPTLYIEDINRILSRLPNLKRTKIRITTNGHFGATKASTKTVLASFLKLDYLQLSYDKFHKEFLPFKNIRTLYNGCLEAGIEFSAAISIQSPLDLVLAPQLKKIGDFPIGVLKVMPAGSAKKNNLAYRYPSFDRRVLSKKCPNHKTITYMCGEGFTSCCSLLSFGEGSARYAHPTMSAHLNSGFYRLISRHSFGEIMRMSGAASTPLSPNHSSACTLCAHLFKLESVRNIAGI